MFATPGQSDVWGGFGGLGLKWRSRNATLFSAAEYLALSDNSNVVVYIEGVTSDLYLEKAHDVQKYTVMYEHLRAQALNVDQSRQLIEDLAKEYAREYAR